MAHPRIGWSAPTADRCRRRRWPGSPRRRGVRGRRSRGAGRPADARAAGWLRVPRGGGARQPRAGTPRAATPGRADRRPSGRPPPAAPRPQPGRAHRSTPASRRTRAGWLAPGRPPRAAVRCGSGPAAGSGPRCDAHGTSAAAMARCRPPTRCRSPPARYGPPPPSRDGFVARPTTHARWPTGS
jgi:hypothetical protein